MVEDEEIGSVLQMLKANLPLAATELIQLANDNGGRDNVSVILVRVNGKFTSPRSMVEKLLPQEILILFLIQKNQLQVSIYEVKKKFWFQKKEEPPKHLLKSEAPKKII